MLDFVDDKRHYVKTKLQAIKLRYIRQWNNQSICGMTY